MVKMRSRGGMPVAFADFEVSYGSGRKPQVSLFGLFIALPTEYI